MPIAPWMTEKFFSGNDDDLYIVMQAVYRLICQPRHKKEYLTIADPINDPKLFKIYKLFNYIMDRFPDSDAISCEFKKPFEGSENLIFRKEGKVEKLIGIKNLPCIQRAIKSFAEMKKDHYLDEEGCEILQTYGINNFSPGVVLTEDELIALYTLCADPQITNMDALRLFYSIFVDEPIFFSAHLTGLIHWKRVGPYLLQYNQHVLQKIRKQTQVKSVPSNGIFCCFGIVEEMAHYPVRVTYEEYRANKTVFRGSYTHFTVEFDPQDFLVYECRCPIMLNFGDGNSADLWFSENMFPVVESAIYHGETKNVTNNPWEDLRPFEDAMPRLLDFLVTP